MSGGPASRLRVLLYVDLDLSRPGGVETHVQELARYLMERGHEVEVFGAPASLPPFHMVRAVEPSRYDVLHHQGGAWPRALPLDGRYVRTLHFCVAAKMATYLRIGRLRTLLNLGNWRAMREDAATVRRPGRIIAVSERLRAEFARWHRLDPARITVIPNGASFAGPRTPRAVVRARYGIGDDALVLLTIGRADFVKGYDLLARAWRRVRQTRPKAVWVTVGGGQPARAPDQVVTGSVPRDEVTDWIHAADLGALPSYYEGCGVALLDMLAGGLYSLTHDVGIASEVIRPQENGEIVPRDEHAWIQALTRALARPRGQVTDGLLDSFRWEALGARTESLYREVIGRRATK